MNGTAITRWESCRERSRASDGKPVDLAVQARRQAVERERHPQRTEGKTIFGEATPIYVIGVEQSSNFVMERSNPVMAVWLGIQRTGELCYLTVMTW